MISLLPPYSTTVWKILAGVIAIIILVAIVGIFKACSKPAKLDERQIQKNQDAIQSKEHEKLVEALVESRVAEAKIDDNLANAKTEKIATINAAKQEANSLTNEELAEALEKLK